MPAQRLRSSVSAFWRFARGESSSADRRLLTATGESGWRLLGSSSLSKKNFPKPIGLCAGGVFHWRNVAEKYFTP
jgi:hypothetical protein